MTQTKSKLPRGAVPVTNWNDFYDWPPPGGLRHLVFNAQKNGFDAAIKRVGRRVLIDPEKFWQIVNKQTDR